MTFDPLLRTEPTPSPDPGDAQAALYDEQRIAMLRLGYLLTGSRSVAEELFHDAFAQVIRRWASIESPGGYLRTAMVNGARSWGRRRRPLPPSPPPEHPAIDPDAIAVRDVLAQLRTDEREVLVLRYYAGLTDRQIADTVDRPIGTVKSQLYRGLRRMRRELE